MSAHSVNCQPSTSRANAVAPVSAHMVNCQPSISRANVEASVSAHMVNCQPSTSRANVEAPESAHTVNCESSTSRANAHVPVAGTVRDLVIDSKVQTNDKNSISVVDDSGVFEVEWEDFSEEFNLKSLEANVLSPGFSTATGEKIKIPQEASKASAKKIISDLMESDSRAGVSSASSSISSEVRSGPRQHFAEKKAVKLQFKDICEPAEKKLKKDTTFNNKTLDFESGSSIFENCVFNNCTFNFCQKSSNNDSNF